MPIEDDARALPLSGGGVLSLRSENMYSTYTDYAKAEADQQQQNMENFVNLANATLNRQDYGMTGVFGEFARNVTGLNQAQDTFNALQEFYSPRNRSVITSNLNTLASAVSENVNIFGEADPRDIAETGRVLRQQGLEPQQAVAISPELREQIKKEAQVSSNAWDSFIAQHKTLAEWLTNPYNYARVKDDVQGQSALSKALQDGAVGALAQNLRSERGEMYLRMQRDSNYSFSEDEQERIRILNAMIKRLQPHVSGDFSIDDKLPYALGGFAATLGEAASYVPAGVASGMAVGVAGGVAGVGAGAVIGAGRGLLMGLGFESGRTEMGNLFGDIYERTGERATAASTFYGATVGVMNSISLGMVGKAMDIGTKTGLFKAIGTDAAKQSAANWAFGFAQSIEDEQIRRIYGIGNTQTAGEMLYNAARAGVDSATMAMAMNIPGYGWLALHGLGTTTRETATMKRGDKETQAEVINAQVRGTNLQTVYLDPDAIVEWYNRADITPAEREDFLRVVQSPQDLDIALQTGKQIPVNLGVFLTLEPTTQNKYLPFVQWNGQQAVADAQGDFAAFQQIMNRYIEANPETTNGTAEKGTDEKATIAGTETTESGADTTETGTEGTESGTDTAETGTSGEGIPAREMSPQDVLYTMSVVEGVLKADKPIDPKDYYGQDVLNFAEDAQGADPATAAAREYFGQDVLTYLDNNKDFKAMVAKSRKAYKDATKNDSAKATSPEIESVVAQVLKEVDAELDDSPMYQTVQALSDDKDFDFSLTLFGKRGKPKNEQDWARKILDNPKAIDDQQWAILEYVVQQHGYNSAGEFLSNLANAPTRDEIRTTAATRARNALVEMNSTANTTALDGMLTQIKAIQNLMYDFREGKDLDYANELVEQNYASEQKRLRAQLKQATEDKNLSAFGSSIRDRRVEMLENQIKELEQNYKDDIKALRQLETARRREAVATQKERDKAQKDKLETRLKLRIGGLQDRIAQQKRYAQDKRIEEREARRGALTPTQAKRIARQNLANATIGELLNVNDFYKAIRQARQRLMRAYVKQDYDEGIKQADRIMSAVAHIEESQRLIKQKLKIDRDMAKFRRYINVRSRKTKNFWGNEDAYNQGMRILFKLGLSRQSEMSNTPSLIEWFESKSTDTGRGDIPYYLGSQLDSYRFIPIADLTLQQYRDINNILKTIANVGRNGKKMYQHDLEWDADTSLKSQLDTIANAPVKESNFYDPALRSKDRNASIKASARGVIRTMLNPETFIRKMEGYTKEHSELWNFWVNMKADRATIKSRMQRELTDRYRGIKDKYYTDREYAAMSRKDIVITELDGQGGVVVSKHDLIGLAMQAGAAENWRKLFSFRTENNVVSGSRQYVKNIPSAFSHATQWDENLVNVVLGKYLTEKDWNFVFDNWKIFDDLWGGMSQFEKARNGFTPERAELRSFDVTLKNGKVLHSNGGFFPLRRDRTAVSGSMQGMDSIMDMLDNTIGDIHNSSRVSMQTRQGQYVARTGANYVVDINYNSLLPSYFDDITSDIAFRDWAFQAARMVKNGQFQTAVISRWGDGVAEMFARNIIDTLGFNKVENIDAMTALVDSTKRSVNAALVANPSTVLQGLTNVFMTPYVVEGWTVADAVRAYWKSFSEAGIPLSQKWRTYVKRAYNLSPLLEDMNANPDFDMYHEYNSIDNNWFFRTRDGLANITMNAMNFIDNLTLIPQFYGIIEKAIREGKSEYEAIRLAEEGIRRIKPSDKKYQQSQFINAKPGSWQRYVNGLQSYGITMLNRTIDTFSLWQHRGFMESLPQIATYVTGTLIMSALATDVIGFRSPFNSDEKDKQTSEGFAKWAANSVLNNIANQIPVFGAIFSAGIARATDEPFYGVKTPSGISTLIEQGTRVTLKVGSEKASAADQVEAIARLTTMSAGVPQYFVNLLFNAIGYNNPRMEFEIRDLFRRRPYNERGDR